MCIEIDMLNSKVILQLQFGFWIYPFRCINVLTKIVLEGFFNFDKLRYQQRAYKDYY